MAADNILVKGFVDFQGIDLTASDLAREPKYATEATNVDYKKSGAMTKRKGFKGVSVGDFGGYGSAAYSNLDITNGQINEEIVSIDEDAYVLRKHDLTITYTGPNTAYVDLFYSKDDDTFLCNVYDNNVLVLSEDLGTVIDQPSFTDIATLITSINALANFSASASGATTVPAAFLNNTRNLILDPASTITYEYLEVIPTPTGYSSPFAGAQAKINESYFENASFANHRSCLYIATGYDALHKYDGQRLYKAGLPTASIDSVALAGAGAITATNIQYKVVYEYTDAKGNVITGIESDLSAKISPAAQQIDITVDNILDTSGYDTDSSDLIIRIYRNRTEDSTTFYEVGFVVNDGTVATQIFTDNVAINSEGVEFIDPIKPHTLPPIAKYISTHQGLLVLTGIEDDVNGVRYSDIDSGEYFPINNSFLTESNFGDKNSGIAPLGNSLFVFKDRSIFQIVGNLADDLFRVDLFGSARIGCVAHATIHEVNGFLLFLSDKGVYSLNQNEQSLEELSEKVEPLFSSYRTTYNMKKAVAVNWLNNDKYVVMLPTVLNDHATSYNVVVFDYFRRAWLSWTSINALGGFVIKDESLYFQERKFRVASGLTETYLYKFQDTGDIWDYADHTAAISYSFKSHWEAMGEPSLFKKFVRCKLHSLELSDDDFESDDFSVRLRTETDYFNTTRTDTTLSFSGSSGGWGVDIWGLFAWGATRLIGRKTKLLPMKCRSLRLILSNDTLHENVLISGYEFEVVPAYKPYIKE